MSSAGDVNGDGFDDVIVGAYLAGEYYGGVYYPGGYRPGVDLRTSGFSYVVFGREGGFERTLALSSLNGTNGFKITGEAAIDFSGRSVSSAGDVNGDGRDDIIIGATGADPNGNFSGASYVVFGRDGGFERTLALSSLNGRNGFKITGEAAFDNSGHSVSSAGDVNGDGIDDIIVGAYRADPNGTSSGASYVVFGRAGGFERTLALSSLNGTNGFKLTGEAADDRSGQSVSSAGDINGDGFDDVIVGAPDADPNGDRSGASYVVFGKAGGFDATLDLSSLNGRNGFKITGEAERDTSGYSVSSAGDLNGDGFGDIIVGAPRSDSNGRDSGTSYVVFGRAGGFNRTLALSSLDGTNGFALIGEAGGGGAGFSVSSAGDVNGDGFDDLVVGVPGASPNSFSSGSSYVVFGRAPNAAVTRIGAAADNTISGGAFGDRLVGLGGNDTLRGGGGGDRLDGGAGADRLLGGDGNDTALYVGAGRGVRVDLSKTTAQSGGDAVGDILDSIENVVGSRFSDVLTGDTGANTLVGRAGTDTLNGGAGDDRLDGGAGVDRMEGGSGDDLYYVDNARDTIVEAASAASGSADKVLARADYTLGADVGIEFMQVLADTGLTLTGNGFVQTIYGRGGADRLDGGGGRDVLRGLSGDDTYIVDNAGVTIVEGSGGGTDTVLASASYVLGTSVSIETLATTRTIGTAAIDLTGNGLAQAVLGNHGANVLDGKGGADTLRGYAGADSFVFSTKLGAGNIDGIVDFKAGEDRILLDADIFSTLDVGSLSESAFKVTSARGAVVDADDRILYDKTTGALSYDADGSGDQAQAVQFATLLNKTGLTFQDIAIV